ncbi:Fc.00g054120.m01.CDS01 [Cosmosporella sp. VM-42]
MKIPVNGTFSAAAATASATATPTIARNKWEVDKNDLGACFIVYGILGFLFFAFLMVVLVDLMRKYRGGDLRKTMSGFGSLSTASVKIPCMIFTKENLGGVWIGVSDIFRKDENKRRGRRKPEPVTFDRGVDSQAIIDKLSSRDLLPPPSKTSKPINSPSLETVKNVVAGKNIPPMVIPTKTVTPISASIDPDTGATVSSSSSSVVSDPSLGEPRGVPSLKHTSDLGPQHDS